MKKSNTTNKIKTIVLILMFLPCCFICGCAGGRSFEQEIIKTKVAPISEKYILKENLKGVAYVLLSETSTGKEEYRSIASDYLADVMLMKKHEKNQKDNASLFLNQKTNSYKTADFSSLEIFSFSDFSNKVNETGKSGDYATMSEFYRRNGMFRKSDLESLGKILDADYFIQPSLLEFSRGSNSRLGVLGLKLINTHTISIIGKMEIWDVKSGYKIFSGISDATFAGERITENPIAVEIAFQKAWEGIIKELPN